MPIKITMPALSPTMTEGSIAKWLKREGDQITAGEVIAEIETDKATMEVEAIDEGILAKIVIPEKTTGVAINTIIAYLLEEGECPSTLESLSAQEPSAVASNDASPVMANDVADAERAPISSQQGNPSLNGTHNRNASSRERRILASPLARRMAEQKGIDLSTLRGSGPRGRIVKQDIAAYSPSLASVKAAPDIAPGQDYTAQPVSTIRKVIAERLSFSKQNIPHFYLTIECIIDPLLSLRSEINKTLTDYRVSVNDFIIKAVAKSLIEVPQANAAWMGNEIHYYNKADISVAVAIDEGLITPIIRSAHKKGLVEISKEMKSLAKRAREKTLKPEEFQGGSFTISNLGMYDIKEFKAIINPPQAAILAVGSGEQRPIVQDNNITIATVINCTLSADHRVIDGAVGAQFLKSFKEAISHPLTLLL